MPYFQLKQTNSVFLQEGAVNGSLITKKYLDLEFISFSDGKEAVAKAANYLFVKHYATSGKEKPNFTEPQMAEALAAIGWLLYYIFAPRSFFSSFLCILICLDVMQQVLGGQSLISC